jgi:hypothetical protein
LGAARVTERHVHVLVELLDPLAATERDAVFPRALVLAEAEPVGTFRRRVRALIDQVRVESLPERHERALDERRVFVEPADDGMAWLNAYLPAVEAHAIHGRLTAIAKAVTAADGDERTLEQARADVFGDLLIDGTCTAHPDAARGIRATVVVTVPALALLDAPTDALNCGVAVVDGVGPIPIDRARELCGGGGGCGSSPTPTPAPSSPSGENATGPHPRCSSSPAGARRGAWHLAAECPPTDATSTTPSPGNTAAIPR